MEYESRPHLHALVAYVSPAFGLLSEPRIMPLEDAVDYARAGFAVLIDPEDEADLVRWEQIERSTRTRAKPLWFKR